MFTQSMPKILQSCRINTSTNLKLLTKKSKKTVRFPFFSLLPNIVL